MKKAQNIFKTTTKKEFLKIFSNNELDNNDTNIKYKTYGGEFIHSETRQRARVNRQGQWI